MVTSTLTNVLLLLALVEQHDRFALAPSARSSTAAVAEHLGVHRGVNLEHDVNIRKVETARGDVREIGRAHV